MRRVGKNSVSPDQISSNMMQSLKNRVEKTAFAHKRDAYIMSAVLAENCFHAIRVDFDG